MGLSRDDILKRRDDLPTREVPTPEWGEGTSVRLRCLTTAERFRFGTAAAGAAEDGPNPTALLVSLSAVDDSGAPLFTIQDSDALAELRSDVMERLADAAMKLSGLDPDAVSDAEENSGATPSGGTPSGSAEPSDVPPTN